MRLLIVMLMILPSICFGQLVDDIDLSERPDIYFVEIVSVQKALFKKDVIISIDYGQKQKVFQKSSNIVDAQGEKMVFNSHVDALNYMYDLGWDLVDSYAVTLSSTNVYHFLLQRAPVDSKE